MWLGKPHRSGSLHGAMDCCCLAGGTRHITRRAWNRALRTEELTQKFHQNSRNFRGILRNFRGASRGLPCGSPPLSLLIVALAAINTPPEMHWLNGVAENTIRVLTRTTRINLCQLVGAVICGVTIKDPQPFWPLAMENAKQVYNYMPNVTLPAFRRPYSLPSLDSGFTSD